MPIPSSLYVDESMRKDPEKLLTRIANNLKLLPGGGPLRMSILISLRTIRARSTNMEVSLDSALDRWLPKVLELLSGIASQGIQEIPEQLSGRFTQIAQINFERAEGERLSGDRISALRQFLGIIRRMSESRQFGELCQQLAMNAFYEDLAKVSDILQQRGFGIAFEVLKQMVNGTYGQGTAIAVERRPKTNATENPKGIKPIFRKSVFPRKNADIDAIVEASDPTDQSLYLRLKAELIDLGHGPDLGEIYPIIRVEQSLQFAIPELRRRVEFLRRQQQRSQLPPRPPRTILMKRDSVVIATEVPEVPDLTVQSGPIPVMPIQKPPNPLEIAFEEVSKEAVSLMRQVQDVPWLYADTNRLLGLARDQFLTGKAGLTRNAKEKLETIVKKCQKHLRPAPVLTAPATTTQETTTVKSPTQTESTARKPGCKKHKENKRIIRRESRRIVNGEDK